MKNLRRTAFGAAMAFAATAALVACSDALRPDPAAPPTGGTLRTGSISCTAQVRSGSVTCGAPGAGGGASAAILMGQQNVHVRLTSSNVSYDSGTGVFQFDVTVQNLIEQTIGTADGVTPHPDGIRVVFSEPPVTTGGSGTITVINASGVGTFTATGQDYFQYDTMLAQSETSDPKTWQLNVPSTVESFSFLLFVSAEVRYPDGYVDVAPDSSEIPAGDSVTLGATVRDARGGVVSGAQVRWSSSDAAVAAVDSLTGVVTGVADGSATITATSGTRTGSAAVTVSTASTANSQVDAAPESLSYLDSAIVTLQLINAAGMPVTHGRDAVGLSASFGMLGGMTSHGNGTYTAVLKATSAGTSIIHGQINGNAIADSAVVTFTAGPPDAMQKTAGDGQSATVGTAVATAPQVRVVDAQGEPVAGVTVTFTVTGGGGSVTGGTATTSSTGHASVGSWTLGTTAGSNTLQATAGALSQTFTATGTAGAAAAIQKVAGDAQADTIEATLATAPSVMVVDSFGNGVAGVAVTFAAAAGNGTVTGGSATTSASGVATVGSWRLGTVVGLDSLTATASVGSVTFTATVTHGNASAMTAQVPLSQTSPKGEAVPAAKLPSVKITDRGGNPISGLTVTFTVGAGDGTATGTTPSTSAAGIATVGSWTLPNANNRNNQMTASRAGLTSVVFTITGN